MLLTYFHTWRLIFSPNLYKYLGNGQRTVFLNKEGYKGWWCLHFDGTTTSWKTKYPIMQKLALSKAIIIGSDSLPVVEEYLPISHHDGHLTHYKTTEYSQMLKDLGLNDEEDNRDQFKKNTLRVLEVFYPVSTSIGDVRSCIIHNTDNIANGQVIEMVPASPITRFNIWVKWMDTYGNLYDLYLYPGCSVDIRLCFIKKSLLKEDFSEGLETVMDRLPEKKEKTERHLQVRTMDILKGQISMVGYTFKLKNVILSKLFLIC